MNTISSNLYQNSNQLSMPEPRSAEEIYGKEIFETCNLSTMILHAPYENRPLFTTNIP